MLHNNDSWPAVRLRYGPLSIRQLGERDDQHPAPLGRGARCQRWKQRSSVAKEAAHGRSAPPPAANTPAGAPRHLATTAALHDTEPSAGNAEAAASRLALAEQRYTRAVAEADASHELTIDDGVGVFDELGVRRSTANAREHKEPKRYTSLESPRRSATCNHACSRRRNDRDQQWESSRSRSSGSTAVNRRMQWSNSKYTNAAATHCNRSGARNCSRGGAGAIATQTAKRCTSSGQLCHANQRSGKQRSAENA